MECCSRSVACGLLANSAQDPLPDFEPDSKMVVFDLVLNKA
jgi:hypothetical protein